MELSLFNLLLVLLAAHAGGAVAQRLGYPVVLGELLVGILLGPALLGVLGEGSWINRWLQVDGGYQALNVLAQVGVLLLMMYIGMEIDPKELGKASWSGFLAALGGFFTPFFMGWGVVYLFREDLPAGMNVHLAGIFVGIAVGVTSLATKSRILFDLKILDTRIAHVMMAGALIADTLSLVVFAGALGFAEQQELDFGKLALVVVRAVLFFGGAALVGLYVLPALFDWVRRAGIKSRGIFFTLMLLVALLYGEAAHLAGLHAILGTFIAGLFLREGMVEQKVNRELNELVRDLSVGFLAPIFFVLAGFDVRFDVFQAELPFFLAIMAVALVGKVAGTALFYLPTGYGWREGVVVGAGMNGRGAVEIILAGIGLKMGLITQEIYSILVFMAIITTASVPLFLKWGTDWLRRLDLLVSSAGKRKAVIIVGASPLARLLAKLLCPAQPVYLIDINPTHAEDARKDNLNVVVGNALESEALSLAQAPACGIAITMTGNAEINALAARQLREVFLVPNLHVLSLGRGSLDPRTFQHLEATSLFARSAELSEWDYWIHSGLTRLEHLPAVAGDASAFQQSLGDAQPTLPLVVERKSGDTKLIFPFHAGMVLKEGDRVVVVRASAGVALAYDRLDELLGRCPVLDLGGALDREAFFTRVSAELGESIGEAPERLNAALHERENLSSTLLTAGLAVPHLILPGRGKFGMLVARCKDGVALSHDGPPAHTLFVLAATPDQRNVHLKALSAIAQIWQSPEFEARWRAAEGPEELRSLILHAQRQRFG